MQESDFWSGINILLRNYHAVNKRIFACIIQNIYLLENGSFDKNLESLLLDGNELTEIDENKLAKVLESTSGAYASKTVIIKFKCIGKKQKECIEILGLIDFSSCTYTCKFQCSTFHDFRVSFKNGVLEGEQLHKTAANEIVDKSAWLESVLLPKLQKWCETAKKATADETIADPLFPTRSLQLVNMEEYAEIYKHLKTKYAQKYMTIWKNAQECTNPLKFIHEDLAIATYLISLWRCQANAPTAFADLGCGNGLLVDVLNEEGFCGYGYDIRARRLWSFYANSDKLIEKPVDPCSTDWLPSDVDWLIGNHSDELSPWLPIIAATAQYKCRYFLLPCCAFELSGAKFQRRNSRLSTYQDFYLYAQELSKKCGFITLQDRLKIPSTKRLALIGMQRIYPIENFAQFRENVLQMQYLERQQTHAVAGDEIKLRDKHEVVRNCTQLDKHTILSLVLRIFHLFLKNPTTDGTTQQGWQRGRALHLSEIAKQMQKDELKQIKSECGGIKTLLRNHHAIFECQGQDVYIIRKPQPINNEMTEQGKNIKKRACFFKLYHPQGCPLNDADCSFIH